MLIRSQSKTAIINIDNVSFIEILDMGTRVMVSVEAMNDSCNIAEYSTKAKAMKVLDMIQEAYCKFLSVKNDDAWNGKESVFYMPEDGSVEA